MFLWPRQSEWVCAMWTKPKIANPDWHYPGSVLNRPLTNWPQTTCISYCIPANLATIFWVWRGEWTFLLGFGKRYIYTPLQSTQSLRPGPHSFVSSTCEHVRILEINYCPRRCLSLTTAGCVPGCHCPSRIQHVGFNGQFNENLTQTEDIIPSTSFGLNGSGCPPGSAFYLLNGMTPHYNLHTLITHSYIAERTAVTVTFSQYYAEAGPGVSMFSNRKNCQLTFGIRYITPLLRLLVITPILSLSQTPWRFLIRRGHYRLRKLFLGSWLNGHSSSNSRSEATISWIPESPLLSRRSITVWNLSITVLGRD